MFRRDQAPSKNILLVRCKLRRDKRILSKTQNLLQIRLTPRTIKRKAARRETCSITINLLELVGVVLTAWVMHELVGDRLEFKGGGIMMRGDNFAAVTWANRCGGARDKRAGLMMRMLGRLEIQGGWRYDAKHISGVQGTLAQGTSRWSRSELADRVRQLTNTDDWSEQSIGARGERLCEIVLQTKNIAPRHDNMLWEIMTGSDQPGARVMTPRSHALYLNSRPPNHCLSVYQERGTEGGG